MLSGSELPYFDEILQKLEMLDFETQLFWGSNVHFGYWDHPHKAEFGAKDFLSATRRMNSVIFERAQLRDGSAVLDVGCGFGGTIKQLDKEFQLSKIVGLNIDSRQIARARKMVLPHVKNPVSFAIGDACELPFKSASFDHILAVECIFHFRSRSLFFQEARRVVKPGGRIVVSDFLYFFPTMPLVHRFLKKQPEFKKWGRLNPAAKIEYQVLAKQNGFSSLRILDITPNILPNYRVLFKRDHTKIRNKQDLTFKLLTSLGLLKYVVIDAQAIG